MRPSRGNEKARLCQKVKLMSEPVVSSISLPKFQLWEKMRDKRALFSFDLEITARCNNNCRHCYINLPAQDKEAKAKELTLEEIKKITEQAVSQGALWCLLTGGEPLLREDFFELYLYLKKKGLLISVFTNACLLTSEQIKFFRKYPPRDIEVTVYGVTQETYERVTRVSGSFKAFMRGLNLLLENSIRVRFKAMALRSNVQELPEIAAFCRKHTKDYFRFDPFLHLRFDGDRERNQEIKSERLLPDEIVAIEKADPERSLALEENCDKLIMPEARHLVCGHIFHCGAGNGSFTVSYDGLYRLCSSLWQKDCLYDLKKGTLKEAWESLVPSVRDMRSQNKDFLQRCRSCELVNLCMWCPAHAHLESGELDQPIDLFCEIAHAREEMLKQADKYEQNTV